MAAPMSMELVSTVLVLLVTYFGVILIRWAVKRHKSHKQLKRGGIPGPQPEFLRGNLRHMKLNPEYSHVITSWIKEYGNVFGFYLGDVPVVVINDQEMLHQLFSEGSASSQHFQNRNDGGFDAEPMNKSLIGLKGKRWKEVRNILSPTFSAAKIKLMTHIMNKKIEVTLKILKQKAEKDEMFDMFETLRGLTLDVIADCFLAMKTHCQDNPNDPFFIAVRDFFNNAQSAAIDIAFMFPFLFTIANFVSRFLPSGQMISLIMDNLEKVIDIRRKNTETKSVDMLQLMLDHANDEKNTSGMTDKEIIANAFLFLFAGYDTTATSLAFTFYLLIKHPDIQERLYQEIKDTEDATYDSIQSLQYLDQVFNETLRFYPPILGFVARMCDHDTQIGSYTIPQGANVIAPVWDIHHDPALWPDPWKFDPDRFAPENNPHKINSTAFMPFGLGRRHCIGQRFALLEAKLTIFRLLKSFRFEVCEKTEDSLTLKCPTSVINYPVNGIYLRAMPRTPSV